MSGRPWGTRGEGGGRVGIEQEGEEGEKGLGEGPGIGFTVEQEGGEPEAPGRHGGRKEEGRKKGV